MLQGSQGIADFLILVLHLLYAAPFHPARHSSKTLLEGCFCVGGGQTLTSRQRLVTQAPACTSYTSAGRLLTSQSERYLRKSSTASLAMDAPSTMASGKNVVTGLPYRQRAVRHADFLARDGLVLLRAPVLPGKICCDPIMPSAVGAGNLSVDGQPHTAFLYATYT